METVYFFYYYFAFPVFIIGIIIILLSLLIKKKSDKIFFGIAGLICLIPFIHVMINNIQIDIENRNDLGPFFQAIDKGKYDKIKQLIEEGQDVNEENISAYPPTPLLYAIDKKNIRTVRLLVENGANVNFKPSRNGSRPLDCAIARGDTAVLNYLLERGADVSLRDGADSIYSIEYATVNLSASKEVVEALLKHGADADCNQGAPLKGAVSKNNYEVVRCLLEHGAKVEPYLPELEDRAKRNFDYLKGRNSFPEDSLQTVKILELLEEYSSKQESE